MSRSHAVALMGFALAACLLAADAYFLSRAVRTLGEAEGSVLVSRDIFAELDQIRSGVELADLNRRFFVYQKLGKFPKVDKAFEDGYEAAAHRVYASIDRLALLTKGDSDREGRFQRMHRVIQARMSGYRAKMDTHRKGLVEPSEVNRSVAGVTGPVIEFDDRVTEMRALEERLLESGVRNGRAAIDRIITCFAIAAFLALMPVAALVIASRRGLAATSEALRRRDAWLDVTLQSVGDALIATDAQGKVVLSNPAAQALTGWKPEEAVGRPLSERLQDPRRVDPPEAGGGRRRRLPQGGRLRPGEPHPARRPGRDRDPDRGDRHADPRQARRGRRRRPRLPGCRRPEAPRGRARAPARRGGVGEQGEGPVPRRAEPRAEDAPEPRAARHLGAARRHPPPEETASTLAMIRRNVELEARLIDDLLDVTRIVQGKLTLRVEPADVHSAIREAAETCRGDLEAAGLRLTVDLPASRHIVRGDPARLQQVFWNLIKNAVKFTPQGGTVAVRSFDEADGLVIEVEDSGIGMEAETLGRIFEPFQQGDLPASRRAGGLGLGLAISRSVVAAHGGTVVATSPGRGRGSKFRVTLPVASIARPQRDDVPPGRDASPSASLRILLVEDDETTLSLMARLLRRLGHVVTTASTLAGGLDAFETGEFDLVISDLGLPDGSGLDLLRQIGPFRALPAIALTGHGMDDGHPEQHRRGLPRPPDQADRPPPPPGRHRRGRVPSAP